MRTVVIRNIQRADADVVKRLGALGASTVHEAYWPYRIDENLLTSRVGRR